MGHGIRVYGERMGLGKFYASIITFRGRRANQTNNHLCVESCMYLDNLKESKGKKNRIPLIRGMSNVHDCLVVRRVYEKLFVQECVRQ